MTAPERKFLRFWTLLKGPTLEQEHKFHPTRRWRFDFAHVITKAAFEIEGGVWSGGRHTRGKGFTEDCVKYSEAQLLGWTVYRITPQMITAPFVERLIAKL